MAHPVRLVVGLGNPGPEYEDTRHNAGFRFVERLAAQLGASLRAEAKFHGRVARAGEVWLLAPTTFMNNSGRAVAALARFYHIPPEQILVVYDELDLPPGEAKLKEGGGHGGHNGLRDILAHLPGTGLMRLRLGIGHPGDRNRVVDYVLHPPSREDAALIDDAIARGLKLWPFIAEGNLNAAMLRLHTKPKKAETKAEAPGTEDS